jgi:hypothetical protein
MSESNIKIFKISFLLIMLLILLIMLPMSYSRYESTTTSNANATVAYYVLDAGYQYVNVKIPNLTPSINPYLYTFSISNNDGTNRTDTLLEYDLIVKTTTNLDLTYELYMNEDYQNPLSTNIITATNIVQDAHNTYFKEMTTNTQYFTYLYDETNNYTLLINFPTTYSSHIYQDIIEGIFLIIESKQVIQ